MGINVRMAKRPFPVRAGRTNNNRDRSIRRQGFVGSVRKRRLLFTVFPVPGVKTEKPRRNAVVVIVICFFFFCSFVLRLAGNYGQYTTSAAYNRAGFFSLFVLCQLVRVRVIRVVRESSFFSPPNNNHVYSAYYVAASRRNVTCGSQQHSPTFGIRMEFDGTVVGYFRGNLIRIKKRRRRDRAFKFIKFRIYRRV